MKTNIRQANSCQYQDEYTLIQSIFHSNTLFTIKFEKIRKK